MITPEKKPTSMKGRDEYRGYESPLDYFNNHPKLHDLSRSKLNLDDPGLYMSLSRYGQLDEAIPKKERYRGYKSPLDYFDDHPELHDLSRSGLSKTDGGLYRSLLNYGQLDKAIPEVRKRGRKSLIALTDKSI